VRVGSGEEFVRGLAEAVPEVFAGVDLADEYDLSEWADEPAGPDDDGWAQTIALADAVQWVEGNALVVHRRRESTKRPPEGADALRRFFAYMEQVIADAPEDDRGWIMVELFEGVPWIEDVIDVLGPKTIESLRVAQRELRRYNHWIGDWGVGRP
jgi:hypothetical protein